MGPVPAYQKYEQGLRTLLGDPNYREYSETPVGADKPSVAYPSTESRPSPPLERKETIVAALKRRIAQNIVEVNEDTQSAAKSKHIRNIFTSGELVREATVSKMETVHVEGSRTVVRTQEFFNLDVIIAVGYRVNSRRATQFRIWATTVLKRTAGCARIGDG